MEGKKLYYHGDPNRNHKMFIYHPHIKLLNASLWDFYESTCPCDNKKLVPWKDKNVKEAYECLGHSDSTSSFINYVADESDDGKTFKIIVDYNEAPECEEYALNAKKVCEEWYPKINKMINGDKKLPFKQINLIFKSETRYPAYCSGSVITVSREHLQKCPKDHGMIVHELVHTLQQDYSGAPHWIIEGTADLIRYHYYEKPRKITLDSTKSYKNGYGITAAFLNFFEKMDANHTDLLSKIRNDMLKNGWDETFFERLSGISLDALWELFVVTHHENEKKTE
mmetsp:Transcript_4448/g.4908  ORF Transcript_4448/g.4908 Transcript_4448/m.4908 type:complete len:282 (-) Transcript_4448:205-1050(-)